MRRPAESCRRGVDVPAARRWWLGRPHRDLHRRHTGLQHCLHCGGGELRIIAAILRGEPGLERF
jgi:hypothetical protein